MGLILNPVMAQDANGTYPAAVPELEKISFADYLKQYDSIEGMRTEWNAGLLEEYPLSTNFRHQEIIGFLFLLLKFFLSKQHRGKVILAGYPMFVGDDKPAREPDLLVVLNEHLDRIQPTFLNGIADLVIEIVSPESTARDYGTKMTEYEALGIPEYWLIDPQRQSFFVYAKVDDGFYHRIERGTDGKIASALLKGLAVDPTWLWQDPLPDALAILQFIESMSQT